MHPILFKIPLPGFTLHFSWIPLILAAIAAVVSAAKMVGKEKDRQGAAIAAGLALLGVIARFTLLKGNTDGWNLGEIPIYSYGVMLGLSLVVGWYLTLGLAERDGLPKETMANNYVVTAIVAVAGARILYILTNLGEFTENPATHESLPFAEVLASFFAMRRGGLVAYGGFLGGLAGSYFFLRRHKLPLLPWADVAVPSLASGLMITRVGCYLFGCDFGEPLKESAPAFLKKLGTFPHWAAGTLEHGEGAPAWAQQTKADWAAEHHLAPLTAADKWSYPVHPTQIYESLVGALLLAVLLLARRKQKFRGQIFFLFAFAYGVCRYLLEVIRDDAERGAIHPPIPQHILIPLGFAVLSVSWVIGFSQTVENMIARRVTQVAAFLPVIALYFAYKPETFAATAAGDLSTSQFIAISSGLAASVAFAIFYKAALAHPKEAMDLHLPPVFQPAAAGTPEGVSAEPSEGATPPDDEEEAPVRRPKKKKKGKAAKKPPPSSQQVTADEDDGEEARAPATAKVSAEDAEKAPPSGGDDEPEPAKAG